MEKNWKPYVDPADTSMPELTFRAVFLGVIMAMVLGGANTYLGLKAGMTVAATFPAAVIAMAVLRFFRGSILEENIARTTGAVGEALAAGAIFTIPAFLIGGKDALWPDFGMINYLQGTLLLLVGGILGVLFVILLRRAFMEDTSLPFPESVACTEIVKAGQGGSSGAGLVFGSMGLAALIEIFKNGNGIPIIGEKVKGLFAIGGKEGSVGGTFPFETPSASPAFLAVGYIIGPKLASITFAGGVFGWLFLMPLVLVFAAGTGNYPDLWDQVTHYLNGTDFKGEKVTIEAFIGNDGVLSALYSGSIKNVAIGAMIVGAFYTLFRMRKNLVGGMARSVKSLGAAKGADADLRTEKDLSFGKVALFILILVGAMFGIYLWLTKGVGVSAVTTIVMAIMGFLFAAVAGYLVGIIGSSSNPISGLTLSTLLIAAGLLVLLGLKGQPGIIAVLGVATVVCCVAGVAGDMLQDWKVGHLLGGTPWKMQVGGLIGVVAAALVLVPIILLLHKSGGGIGSEGLAAPQAGLMHKTAVGIIGGLMPWHYIVIGMLFALALILIGSPSPMLIAVGMYLPFTTTAAIFVGGLIKWVTDRLANRKFKDDVKAKERVENRGLLVASGLVAGEAMIGICLAGVVAANVKLFCGAQQWVDSAAGKLTCVWRQPDWFHVKALGFLVILGLAIFMISMSMKGVKPTEPEPPASEPEPPASEPEPPAPETPEAAPEA
ncbi:MAG: oligopeptide transporter, OPT family [Polyangia bacterium]|jgi:OPT family oligopeptide transporter|nr:oligopeptide transporter, OPT family [Polyangia bacterium]